VARLINVARSYGARGSEVWAARNVSLTLARGSFAALTGPSGSGKSTLLNLLGCLDRPTQGAVEIEGRRVSDLSDADVTAIRARSIGFVFQNFNLLPTLTALENVEYPLLLLRRPASERRHYAKRMLAEVGLDGLDARRPAELSGGQKQRVAIARALVKNPCLVLADEPTANLDSVTAADLMALMRRVQASHSTTFLFSTHDPALIAQVDEVYRVRDGRIEWTTE